MTSQGQQQFLGMIFIVGGSIVLWRGLNASDNESSWQSLKEFVKGDTMHLERDPTRMIIGSLFILFGLSIRED